MTQWNSSCKMNSSPSLEWLAGKKKSTYVFSRVLSGIWNRPVSFGSTRVHLSILNVPASCPAATRSFWSGCSTQQALENIIQVPMKRFSFLKGACAPAPRAPQCSRPLLSTLSSAEGTSSLSLVLNGWGQCRGEALQQSH